MLSGVQYSEQDLSSFIPTLPGGYSAIAGPLPKGPIGEYRDVSSVPGFERIYGKSYGSSRFIEYCKALLDNGAKLRISRVAHATDPNDIATLTAVKSTRTIVDRSAAVAGPAVLTSSTAGPWQFDNGTTFTKEIGGVPEATQTVSVSRASLVAANDEASGWDFTGGRTLEIRTRSASHPLQILSIPDTSFAVPASPTAAELAQAINDESPIGASAIVNTSGPNPTVELITDIKGTGAYLQVVGGTINADLGFSTTAVTGAGDFANHTEVTPAELATFLQGASHGTTYNNSSDATSVSITTIATGPAATARLVTPSTGAGALGLVVDGSPVTGTPAAATVNTLRVDASSEGVWADGLQFFVEAATNGNPLLFNLRIPVQAEVTNAELWENLSMTSTDSRYFVDYVNTRSEVVRLADLASASTAPTNLPALGTYTLTGGNDGLTGLTGNDFLGGSASKLGVHAFDGVADTIDLFTPTIHDDVQAGDTPAAMQSIIDYCEARRDMVYHMVAPNPANDADVIAFRNGTAPYTHTKFNSNYATLMASTGQLNQPVGLRTYNAQAQYAAALSYNDTGNGRQSENVGPWFAPSNERRARTKFQKITPLLHAENQTDARRAALEAAQINYLAQLNGRVVFWNQATLQLDTSALSDLNVRRSMIFFEQQINKAILSEAFEPNDPVMYRNVARKIEKFLQQIKDKRGLEDFAVRCDQDVDSIDDVQVNSLADIEQGIFRCLVYIKPKRVAKTIALAYTVVGATVTFEEAFEVA